MTQPAESQSAGGRSLVMRVLREPLVYFLIAGAALFLVSEMRAEDQPTETLDTIVISDGHLNQMIEIWTKTWQRPPTQQELRGLIDQFVREEVLYREAMAMGLDVDDTIVRRRLAQKMEFVAEGFAFVADPTPDQLQELLDAESDFFSKPGNVSFQHVFVNADERGDAAVEHANTLLEQLVDAEVDAFGLGDSILLEFEYRDQPTEGMARLFGGAFADSLVAAKVGRWTGPVESGYGLHLVHVIEITPAEVSPLVEIEDEVAREWRSREERTTREELIQSLIDQYEVVIETSDDQDRLKNLVGSAQR